MAFVLLKNVCTCAQCLYLFSLLFVQTVTKNTRFFAWVGILSTYNTIFILRSCYFAEDKQLHRLCAEIHTRSSFQIVPFSNNVCNVLSRSPHINCKRKKSLSSKTNETIFNKMYINAMVPVNSLGKNKKFGSFKVGDQKMFEKLSIHQ